MRKQFHQMVKLHQNQVFTLALYMLYDRAEAEDVTQETFIKLWQRMQKTDEEVKRAWLLRVARNACIDRFRKQRPVSHEVPEQADWQGPQFQLEQDQLGTWLKQAIAGLKEPYRSLIVMRDVQQHSYKEIAHTLEMSHARVKVCIYRARQQLRKKLPETGLA